MSAIASSASTMGPSISSPGSSSSHRGTWGASGAGKGRQVGLPGPAPPPSVLPTACLYNPRPTNTCARALAIIPHQQHVGLLPGGGLVGIIIYHHHPVQAPASVEVGKRVPSAFPFSMGGGRGGRAGGGGACDVRAALGCSTSPRCLRPCARLKNRPRGLMVSQGLPPPATWRSTSGTADGRAGPQRRQQLSTSRCPGCPVTATAAAAAAAPGCQPWPASPTPPHTLLLPHPAACGRGRARRSGRRGAVPAPPPSPACPLPR